MNFITQIKEELNSLTHQTEVAEYVATAFLNHATGSLTRGYHIEFALDSYEEAGELSAILAMFEMLPKLIGRGGKFVVYLKSGECLCNLLALVGANRSLMQLHNEIAMRDLKNNANRRANCDTANIAKQVNAAHTQIEVIIEMQRTGKLADLSPRLRETALARIENPDASYEELALLLGITKSGVVNRLRNLTSGQFPH